MTQREISDRAEAEIIRAQIEYWKQVVWVQTHFNDMCIRTRWVGLTVTGTILAAAAVAFSQFPEGSVSALGVEIHIAAILFAIASLVSVALWQLDRKYYYNMLIASVDHTEAIEQKFSSLLPEILDDGRSLTKVISEKVSRKRSRDIVGRLYVGMVFIPLALAIIVTIESCSI